MSKTYTVRTDVLDATFDDAEHAAVAAALEVLEGAESLDIEVGRANGRSHGLTDIAVDREMIAAARSLRRAARRFWRLVRPVRRVT